MRVLGAQDVEEALPMPACIRALEQGLRQLAAERITMPARLVVPWPEQAAVWLLMPIISHDRQLFTVKVISEYRRNPERYGLPAGSGIVLLADGENGRFLAGFDARTLTALRTGALGGVSAKYLARRESHTVGLLGSGDQARTQLQAVLTVRQIHRVRVYSRQRTRRERFAREMAARTGTDVQPVERPQAAVADADIVIAATNSATPVLKGGWVSRGTHIISVGALPERRELDAKTFERANLVVADLKEAVLREAGDVIYAVKHGVLRPSQLYGIHEIIAGVRRFPREPRHITLFKSVGFAFLDLVAAQSAYRVAETRSLGHSVKLGEKD